MQSSRISVGVIPVALTLGFSILCVSCAAQRSAATIPAGPQMTTISQNPAANSVPQHSKVR